MVSTQQAILIVFISLITSIILSPINSYAGSNTALNNKQSTKKQRVFVYVTLYGSPDNDPPNSGKIAHPVIHKQAGGIGTYSDPITYAVKKGYLSVGTIIYYPTLRKYFIMEDDCASCSRNQVDLWSGYGTEKGGIIECEKALTKSSDAIIISPASNLTVDVTPIWDESKHRCQQAYS